MNQNAMHSNARFAIPNQYKDQPIIKSIIKLINHCEIQVQVKVKSVIVFGSN